MAKFSPAQNVYMMAKAAYEVAQAELNRRQAPLATDCTDAEFDAYYEVHDAIRQELGLEELFSTLIDAEENLLAWCHEQVKVLPQYKAHAADIQRVISTRNPKFRPQVLDLACKLAV
jgi:tryptophan 2,3-dioxygenase